MTADGDDEDARILAEALSTLPRRRLHSALIGHDARRAEKTTSSDVRRQHESSPLVRASALDQRAIIAFESDLSTRLPSHVSMIEVSPVMPFGALTAITGLDGKLAATTTRNVDVVSDALIPLALELDRMLAGTSDRTLWAATCHRELRLQPPERPEFSSHFRAFSLISGVVTRHPTDSLVQQLAEHLQFYLELLAERLDPRRHTVRVELANVRLLRLLADSHPVDWYAIARNAQRDDFSAFAAAGISLPARLALSPNGAELETLPQLAPPRLRKLMEHTSHVFRAVLERCSVPPEVDLRLDLERHAGARYYDDFACKIWIVDAAGGAQPVVDLGTTGWLRRLHGGDRRHRCVAGGLGTEVLLAAETGP